MTVRFTTYNLLDLFAAETAEARQHYETIAGVIRALDADVLAVQEILAPDAATAAGAAPQARGRRGHAVRGTRLGWLGLASGLRSSGSEAAVAFGGHGYHVGLMWREGIEPVPGSLRCYGGRDFWHGLALVTLDVGGTRIRHGSFHATPFSPGLRADQNVRLVAAVTRPAGEPPVLVGADWNTECADRIPDGQAWTLYEPADPYAGVEWFADLIYQCQWDYDERGRRRHWADRRPGDVLWAGGLHDVAAVTGAGLAAHDRASPGRRLRRARGPAAHRRRPGDRAARSRHARAPRARHRADPGGLRPSAGDRRVPARGAVGRRRARRLERGSGAWMPGPRSGRYEPTGSHGSAWAASTAAPSVTSLNTRSRAGAASRGVVGHAHRRVVTAHMGANV